jgi:hypothetical protein
MEESTKMNTKSSLVLIVLSVGLLVSLSAPVVTQGTASDGATPTVESMAGHQITASDGATPTAESVGSHQITASDGATPTVESVANQQTAASDNATNKTITVAGQQIIVSDNATNATATVDIREPEQPRAASSPLPFEIVVEDANEGISAIDIAVSINETMSSTNASFVGYDVNKSTLDNSHIDDNGSTVHFEVALLDDSYDPSSDVTVATAVVVADDIGNVTLEANQTKVVGINSEPLYNTSSERGHLSLVEPPPAFPGFDQPQDLTGDGLFGDVTGSGDVGLADALVLFDNRFDIGSEHAEFFNFARDEDPDGVGLADALALFDERKERSP